MTRNILIIGRKKAGEKNDVEELVAALRKRSANDVNFRYAYFDEIVFKISPNQVECSILDKTTNSLVPIETYDTVILIHWTVNRVLSDIAHSIALVAEHKKLRIWNEEALQARSMTKLSQLVRLGLAGHRIPTSVFALEHVALHEAAAQSLYFPIVCKDITASRGRSNFLIETSEELGQTLEKNKTAAMIAQEFIENDQSDLRFFIAGGKVKMAIKRSGNTSSHLNNISAGGTAAIVALDTFDRGLLHEIEGVARLFGRELCGIDYMFDTVQKQYVFLEINGTPQIINGVFPEEKIDSMLEALENREDN